MLICARAFAPVSAGDRNQLRLEFPLDRSVPTLGRLGAWSELIPLIHRPRESSSVRAGSWPSKCRWSSATDPRNANVDKQPRVWPARVTSEATGARASRVIALSSSCQRRGSAIAIARMRSSPMVRTRSTSLALPGGRHRPLYVSCHEPHGTGQLTVGSLTSHQI